MGRNIDSLIKEVVKEKYDNIICPPKEEIWEQLELRLSQKRNKIIIRRSNTFFKIQAPLMLIHNYISSKLGIIKNKPGQKRESETNN